MITRAKRDVACSSCSKQFPIVIEYDADKIAGSRTREVYCPFCDTLLTIELPGGATPTTTVFRGTKKAE